MTTTYPTLPFTSIDDMLGASTASPASMRAEVRPRPESRSSMPPDSGTR
jgi:hypothetical protein